MAKFFVGQRVRMKLARSAAGEAYIGLQARIDVAQPSERLSPCSDFGLTFDNGDEGAVAYWQIEPILPDGHRAGEEGTCEPLDKLLSEVRHASVE